jgi:tellurite resistance protein/HAMP domain-containing protein
MERPPPRYLIDRRFQLKYTGLLVAVALVLLGGLGVVIWRESQVSVEQARVAAAQAEKALVEAQTSSRILRMNTADAKVDEDLAELDKQNATELAQARARSEQIRHSRDVLLSLLIGAGLAVLIILGATGLYITRRIVAPVFHLKRLLRKVGTGRLVIQTGVPPGGELDDLFHTFLQMTYSLRALQNEWLQTLDQAIAELPSEKTARLQQLREQLGRGLGQSQPPREPERPRRSQTHPLIDTAIQALCRQFEAADYGLTPIIDLGTLIANADGTIDPAEVGVLRYLFQTLLDARLSPQMVQHLVDASLAALSSSDREARARLIAEILLDCEAVEPGLTVALTVAFASEGFSKEERALVETIATAAGVPAARLTALIAEVEGWNVSGLLEARG